MSDLPNFYTFTNNTAYMPRFTWAYTYVPRSEMLEYHCPEVGVKGSIPAGAFDVIVEGGSIYPDILGCGHYPFLIVSGKVVSAWCAAGVTSFETFPVNVCRVDSKKLRRITPPDYYRVEITGRCSIDIPASGGRILRQARECQYIATDPSILPGFTMVPGSWDGSPLFRDYWQYPAVSFCTQLIFDIAREYKLTNFCFEPMTERLGPFSEGLDYF